MGSPESDTHNRGVDAALLVLRLGAGLSLFLIFGLSKMHDASAYLHTGQWSFVDFNRKVGLPLPVLVAFVQTLNESVAAVFLAAGLLARASAGCLTIGFAVATYFSLKVGEPAWMMAGYFCLMFLTLWLAGPGRFSVDQLVRSRKANQAAVD
jgi:uncharacterized membrane protein YphA (DoxX/SURF4 family)